MKNSDFNSRTLIGGSYFEIESLKKNDIFFLPCDFIIQGSLKDIQGKAAYG